MQGIGHNINAHVCVGTWYNNYSSLMNWSDHKVLNWASNSTRGTPMTTDVVLDGLELGDDCDDMDEPMIPGSENEFSDCALDENENDDNFDSDEDINDKPTSS